MARLCEKLWKGKLLAASKWRYANHAIFSLVNVATSKVPTLACDQYWRLYYNEEALDGLTVEEVSTKILKEMAHLILRHHQRAESFIGDNPEAPEWQRWNKAATICVHDALRECNIRLPEDTEFPETYGLKKNQSTDSYYCDLRANEQQEEQDGKNQKGQQSGQPGNGHADLEHGAPGENDSQDNHGAGEADSLPAPAGVDSGSSADGIPRPWDLGYPTQENEGLDGQKSECAIKRVADNVNAAKHGADRGRWKLWADKITKPKVNPRAALARFIKRACKHTISGYGDYSYRRPSRRNPSPDVVLPSNVQPVPQIVMLLDTSGSMDASDTAYSLGFVGGVIDSFGLKDGVQVVCADTHANAVQKVFRADKVQLKGGGGTDMGSAIRQVLDRCKSKRDRPELIVVCTDGYTPWCNRDAAQGVPVVACFTREPHASYKRPDWIGQVQLVTRPEG